ncbi:MAG: ATP-binding cassette domain-containing protein [Rhodobacteraceae bacterium]|nr:ATP-binding cassette domain-containing protein [Paracoccaceae bacterium]
MSAPVLVFDSVSIHADGNALLGPVSLTLATPGITVVMGPNGAGKSLFLAAAHGLLKLEGGHITWDGRDAATSRAARGFVFQATPVLRRSVAGNVAFPLIARKHGRAEIRTRVASALDEARLSALARQPAAALSGGELKRLDLARAMVGRPTSLLLDEPSANLDPASTAELEKALHRIAARGVKVLVSTHDVAQARRLADDILFFDAGQLAEQADAETFFAAPASTAAQKYLRGEL